MPTCGPDYANVGYKEYFNANPPGPQYSNYANQCIQSCPVNTRGTVYGNIGALAPCTQSICNQSCQNATMYGAATPAMQDDCSQYSNYSNCTNYARNTTGSSSILSSLGLNQPLIDEIVDIPTSITAIQHLRDKLATLIDNKLRQTSVTSSFPATIADSTFNDGNSATTELTLASQYNALKTKMDAFWNALKAEGTTLTTPVSDSYKSSGASLFKSSILALKADLVSIANACYQAYANYQNGYPPITANTYTDSVATYQRNISYVDAICTQYRCTDTGSSCGYQCSDYTNCGNTVVCATNYFNTTACWNYANHSNHSNHSNYSRCDNCRRDN